MFNISMRGGAAAAIAACLLTPTMATATTGPTKSAKVSYAGLNLTSATGKATLERRVSRAADRVCGVGLQRDIRLAAITRRCAAEARAAARPAIELAYRNAADGQLAAQDVSVTVAP